MSASSVRVLTGRLRPSLIRGPLAFPLRPRFGFAFGLASVFGLDAGIAAFACVTSWAAWAHWSNQPLGSFASGSTFPSEANSFSHNHSPPHALTEASIQISDSAPRRGLISAKVLP